MPYTVDVFADEHIRTGIPRLIKRHERTTDEDCCSQLAKDVGYLGTRPPFTLHAFGHRRSRPERNAPLAQAQESYLCK
jgi:hypothetical protein